MKMGGFYFDKGDTQADYQKHSRATFRSILWWTRYKGIEDGWPNQMLKKRLIRIAKVLQSQTETKNRIDLSEIRSLLDF